MNPCNPFSSRHLDEKQKSHQHQHEELNLEPSPIGPRGIDVVDRISLETSPLARGKDVHATRKCLEPLLIGNLRTLPFHNEEGRNDDTRGATAAGLFSASHKQNRSDPAYELADHATTTKMYEQEEYGILNDLPTFAHRVSSDIRPLSSVPTTSSTDSFFDGADMSIASSDSSTSKDNTGVVALCRQSQTDQWYQRYQELVEFRDKHGHCLVPLKFPEKPALAHWRKSLLLGNDILVH